MYGGIVLVIDEHLAGEVIDEHDAVLVVGDNGISSVARGIFGRQRRYLGARLEIADGCLVNDAARRRFENIQVVSRDIVTLDVLGEHLFFSRIFRVDFVQRVIGQSEQESVARRIPPYHAEIIELRHIVKVEGFFRDAVHDEVVFMRIFDRWDAYVIGVDGPLDVFLVVPIEQVFLRIENRQCFIRFGFKRIDRETLVVS